MKGVVYNCRREVVEDIIRWWKAGYLVTDGITSIKALADWVTERDLFLTNKGNPLSYNTIKQEFGEIWREMQQDENKKKFAKTGGYR